MKFCWCTITVRNMEESLAFYREIVGLEVTDRVISDNGTEIVFLGNGETKVELISQKEVVVEEVGQPVSLGFEVSSLDTQLEKMKQKGIAVTAGPFQPNPKVRFFYIQGPDGVNIQFVEQLL
ncbi:VOC family protein [uncultured Sphaerochaeta sp.]|uniref:VOC family protein n=1 Tax=uncultured Sphaerochaeta sp. TaxID=886478 RepID=UPI002A0A32AC|nr:VOC family protein [uncultured Sphaerochaeta sp.]